MLGILSKERHILGVDYDGDKIDIAQNAFLRQHCNAEFLCADMREVCIPSSDAILFNDSLHYIDAESQKEVLKKAVASLNRGGMIIVRDGDAGQTKKHEKIKMTELWSTQIVKFNKTTTNLTFVSEEWMRDFATANGVDIRIHRCDKDSSETLYILTKLCV